MIDELWEKHTACGAESGYMIYEEFTEALTEYGEHIKAEAVKVCKTEESSHVMSKYAKVSDCQIARQSAHNCAAAIAKMEIK